MLILAAVCCGFCLDLLLGDPPWMPHPVVWMGKCIALMERGLRSRLPATPRGECTGGAILTATVFLGTLGVAGGVCALLFWLHPVLGFLMQTLWCWQALAMRGLRQESRRVYLKLTEGTLPEARKAVSRIVGRDTQDLSAEGVIKAAVETVAENFTDGVFAPLLYMSLGGAPLAMAYKAVNTMDSMLGYQNETFRYFGRAAAKLDDGANYIPSRLAALLWIGAAMLTGQDGAGALRIWRRDARKHASPNAGQTEAACAGSLGVQLAGPAYYFGTLYEKPAIGDENRAVVPQDIVKTNRMLYAAGVLGLVLCLLGRALAVWMVG